MNTSEARRAASSIAYAENPVESALELTQEVLGQLATGCAVESEDINTLKAGEFGLLVGPVVQGVERFLENPEAEFAPDERCNAGEIGKRVGMQIFEHSLDALRENGELEQLMKELAEARAQLVDNPNVAAMLSFETSLRSAAGSSAQSMINVALANAQALQRVHEGRLTRIDLVSAVHESTHLALAIPMVHLVDLPIVNTILSAHNYSGLMGRGYPDNILQVNPDTNRVSLGKPLQQWNIGPALTIAETEAKNDTVRIGCPFSFADKEVRVGYYQAIVGLMDHHMPDVWPINQQG